MIFIHNNSFHLTGLKREHAHAPDVCTRWLQLGFPSNPSKAAQAKAVKVQLTTFLRFERAAWVHVSWWASHPLSRPQTRLLEHVMYKQACAPKPPRRAEAGWSSRPHHASSHDESPCPNSQAFQTLKVDGDKPILMQRRVIRVHLVIFHDALCWKLLAVHHEYCCFLFVQMGDELA